MDAAARESVRDTASADSGGASVHEPDVAAARISTTNAAAPIAAVAADAAAYAQAWFALASGEASLAKRSLIRLVAFALLIPASALAVFLCFDALLVVTLATVRVNLALAVFIVWLLDVAVLGAILWFMRRWWTNLTFPRSRAALTRFMESVK